MGTVTNLPHDTQDVGVLWDNVLQKGNYDNWGRLPVTTIILHSMDGYVGGSTSWFKTHNQSANYGIGMDGKITSWIPENCVAYHAGKYPVNQVSIGIEHEDNGDNQILRPDTLYETSGQLVANICREYNIPADSTHVKLHNEIVATSCPGTLNRDRILKRANELLTPVMPKAAIGQMVQVDPDVFAKIVTKSSEYDEVWKALQQDKTCDVVFHALEINANAPLQPGSHQVILQYISQKILNSLSSSKQNAAAIPSEQTVQELGSNTSVMDKNITQILSEFLMFLKLKKQV